MLLRMGCSAAGVARLVFEMISLDCGKLVQISYQQDALATEDTTMLFAFRGAHNLVQRCFDSF